MTYASGVQFMHREVIMMRVRGLKVQNRAMRGGTVGGDAGESAACSTGAVVDVDAGVSNVRFVKYRL